MQTPPPVFTVRHKHALICSRPGAGIVAVLLHSRVWSLLPQVYENTKTTKNVRNYFLLVGRTETFPLGKVCPRPKQNLVQGHLSFVIVKTLDYIIFTWDAGMSLF